MAITLTPGAAFGDPTTIAYVHPSNSDWGDGSSTVGSISAEPVEGAVLSLFMISPSFPSYRIVFQGEQPPDLCDNVTIDGVPWAVTSSPGYVYDADNDESNYYMESFAGSFDIGTPYEVSFAGASTLVAGDVFGAFQGYFTTPPAGSLSPEPLAGQTVILLITGGTADRISLEFSGDATAALSGLTGINVDGTSYPVTSGPTFSSGATDVEFGPAPAFTVGNSYTIALEGIGGSPPTYEGPTYVGKSTANGSASGFNISFSSSGRASGDLLFIAVETANQAVTAPSGWTEVATYSPQSRGTAAAAGGVRLTLFSKTSDGTEGNVAIPDSGNHQYAVGIVVRGVDSAAVEIEAGAGNNVAASTSCTFGGVTTSVDNCLICTFVATDRDSAGPSFSSEANSNLANLTEQHDAGTTAGVGGGIAIYTGEKQTAGATGNTTATQAASSAYCWITLALKNGSSGLSGTASITEAADTSSATSVVALKGAATKTESADTSAATGKIAIAAAFTMTEEVDILSSAGELVSPIYAEVDLE